MVIKGTVDGLILEPEAAEWQAFLMSLAARLMETESFFRGGQVTLRAGSRAITAAQLQELQGLLTEYGLMLVAVDTSEPETRQAADRIGVSQRPATVEKVWPGRRRPLPPDVGSLPVRGTNGGHHGEEGNSGVIVRRTLRSGQIVHFDGDVVIMGDVNPGAEVVATGDVLVWGRLRGLVHAGASGNPAAQVCALQLSPTQLRIGEHIARPPEDDRRRKAGGPEVARVSGGRIVVEAWNKP